MDLLSGGFVEQAPLFQGYWCVHRTGSSGIPGLFNRSERSDKMTKRIKLVAAIVMAFAAQSAIADVDFGGYLRSGSGGTTKGGTGVCFRLKNDSAFDPGQHGNVDGAGRLGSECDTYGEIKLGATMGNSDGTKFGVHTLVAYGTQQVADYEQTIPALRESYASAEGFGSGAFAKSTVWVGKRFYNRKDVYIVDLFWLEVAGPGAGIENIDVGVGKFSYAMLKFGNANYSSLTGDNTGGANGGGQQIGRVTLAGNPGEQLTNHDFRLEGINLGKAGSLGFGTNIIRENNTGLYGNQLNGYSAWVNHSIVMFGGIQNGLILQTAHGAGSLDGEGLSWTNSTNPGVHSGWRVIESVNFEFGDKLNGAGFLGYGKENFPWFGTTSCCLSKGTDVTTTSLVVRPIYHFTENFGLAVEGGTTLVRGSNLNYDGNFGYTTNHLNKLSISPQLSMGSGFFAKPVLRAYVNFFNWNKGGARACTGRECQTVVAGTFDNVTSATTYGVQMEAWW
jgi:maltoporin